MTCQAGSGKDTLLVEDFKRCFLMCQGKGMHARRALKVDYSPCLGASTCSPASQALCKRFEGHHRQGTVFSLKMPCISLPRLLWHITAFLLSLSGYRATFIPHVTKGMCG